jgi:hypothetical protein
MSRWQYHVVDLKPGLSGMFKSLQPRDELQAALDRLGQQGWELVQMTPGGAGSPTRLVLKRPA